MSSREKYPEKCPWDFGPKQKQRDQPNWKLSNGDNVVIFAKNKEDENYFFVTEAQSTRSILSFRARLLYQKLLDKGYKLQGS